MGGVKGVSLSKKSSATCPTMTNRKKEKKGIKFDNKLIVDKNSFIYTLKIINFIKIHKPR